MQIPYPVPTPTLPPNITNQIIQTSEALVDRAFQQGIVGFLLLCALALVIYMVVQLLRTYTQRNNKPDNPTSGINEAISGLVTMNENRDKEAALDREDRKREQEQWRNVIEKQIQNQSAQSDKYIEAISHYSDAQFMVADTLKQLKQAADGASTIHNNVAENVNTIVTIGSVPLRQLIATVEQIKTIVSQVQTGLIPFIESVDTAKEYQERFTKIENDVDNLRQSLATTIEEKRRTDTNGMQPVTELPSTP